METKLTMNIIAFAVKDGEMLLVYENTLNSTRHLVILPEDSLFVKHLTECVVHNCSHIEGINLHELGKNYLAMMKMVREEA